MATLAQRALHFLNPSLYAEADQSIHSWFASEIEPPKEQYILRMMIKSPWSDGYQIPDELQWLKNAIHSAAMYQKKIADHPFVYVTVRSGIVKSVTDDEWHVDGFSMRVPHAPEQNYIWTDHYPTEVLNQKFDIPADFDPMQHNIHQFFQDRADASKIEVLESRKLHLIDPYIVHRRPAVPAGTQRTFFRISFVPIEIEDDTCIANPLLPTLKYNREDIRKKLSRYPG